MLPQAMAKTVVLTGNMWFSRAVLGLVGGLVSNSFGGEFSGGPIIKYCYYIDVCRCLLFYKFWAIAIVLGPLRLCLT